MGRPSKLTDSQRSEAQRRLAGGESFLAVSRSMKIPKTTLVRNFSDQIPKLKTLAGALVSVETEMAALPISDQVTVRSLADQLKGLQVSAFGSAVAAMRASELLNMMALKQIEGMDPSADMEDMRPIAGRLEMAVKASSLGVSLLNANKDRNGALDTTSTPLTKEARDYLLTLP